MTQTLEKRIAQLNDIALGAGNARKFTSLEGLAASALIVIEELQQKNDLLELEKGELIKAINYIRSSDSSTESAAKAIEMLKKYEKTNN